MIQIILLLLKIIGITLLVLLGLILLVIALVLFVPICYRIRVIWKPDHKEIKGRVTFLFPFVIASVGWLEKLWYRVRIAGFCIVDSEKPKKEKRGKENSKKEKPKKEMLAKGKTEEKKPELPVTEKRPDVSVEGYNEAGKREPKEQKQKESDSGFKKIRQKWQNLRDTVRKAIAKIGRLLRQKDELQKLLSEPETKQVFSFIWEKCKKLFKHILPRKSKGYVAYGSSDPSTTGKVMGIISVLYAKTGPLVRVVPNFEEEQLEADLELKGRIQLFTLLVLAGKVFINKEIKQLIQKFKNIKEVE